MFIDRDLLKFVVGVWGFRVEMGSIGFRDWLKKLWVIDRLFDDVDFNMLFDVDIFDDDVTVGGMYTGFL